MSEIIVFDPRRVGEIIASIVRDRAFNNLGPTDFVTAVLQRFGECDSTFLALETMAKMGREWARLDAVDRARPRLDPEARRRRKRADPQQLTFNFESKKGRRGRR